MSDQPTTPEINPSLQPDPTLKSQIHKTQTLVTTLFILLFIGLTVTFFLRYSQLRRQSQQNLSMPPQTPPSNTQSYSDTTSWRTFGQPSAKRSLLQTFFSLKLPPGVHDPNCNSRSCSAIITWLPTNVFLVFVEGGRQSTDFPQLWQDLLSELKFKNISYSTDSFKGKESLDIKTTQEFSPFIIDRKEQFRQGSIIRLNENEWFAWFIYKTENGKNSFPSQEDLELVNKIISNLEISLASHPADQNNNWNTIIHDNANFTVSYPPEFRGIYDFDNNPDISIVKKDQFSRIYLTIAPDFQGSPCANAPCNNSKDIYVTIANDKIKTQQIWPDNNGDFSFKTVISQPTGEESLSFFGHYSNENDLETINRILSTFRFIDSSCPQGQIRSRCKLGPCCCPTGAICD